MQTWQDRWLSSRGAALFISALVVALSFTLSPTTEAVSLFGIDVPTLCLWRNLTGISCPGCGLTRSFTFFAHGHVGEAFQMHALGPLLFVAVAAQVPYQIYRIAVDGPSERDRADA